MLLVFHQGNVANDSQLRIAFLRDASFHAHIQRDTSHVGMGQKRTQLELAGLQASLECLQPVVQVQVKVGLDFSCGTLHDAFQPEVFQHAPRAALKREKSQPCQHGGHFGIQVPGQKPKAGVGHMQVGQIEVEEAPFRFEGVTHTAVKVEQDVIVLRAEPEMIERDFLGIPFELGLQPDGSRK